MLLLSYKSHRNGIGHQWLHRGGGGFRGVPRGHFGTEVRPNISSYTSALKIGTIHKLAIQNYHLYID